MGIYLLKQDNHRSPFYQEDILEELVGEIWDEHDEVEEPFRRLDEYTHMIDCSVTLDDFCDYFGISCESDSISLGGWIMEQMGRIPGEGDCLHYENLTVTVSKTDEHRVEFVTVTVNEPVSGQSGV